jgi:hypothetical protein
VSKTDISQSKTDISQLETDISQSKTDISQLETDISQSATDISQYEIVRVWRVSQGGRGLSRHLPAERTGLPNLPPTRNPSAAAFASAARPSL